MPVTGKTLKVDINANPISANIFCADPCCIEHEGRLYIYGTNDSQQYEESGIKSSNTYEKISSLVCFSTEDMTNWTFHGIIDVKKLAPWILSAWNPTVVKRQEKDGLTHFYLYFSNNGCGVGVLTATNPLGPWTAPLKKALINYDMKALNDVPTPFAPGICFDKNNDPYLVCGGGYTKQGNDYMPGTARIVKLSQNMTSFDSKFVEIKAPYFFENSELFYINDTFVYTYNNNWSARDEWNFDGIDVPSACSISYMSSKFPLESESWQYKGHFFMNPGEMGFNYSNNHIYLYKYKGKNYIFYHSLAMQTINATATGYRSICVDEIQIDEENVKLPMTKATKKGVESVGTLNPFEIISATTMFNCENIYCPSVDSHSNNASVSPLCDGAWLEIKNADFEEGAEEMFLQVKGKGIVNIYADSLRNSLLCSLNIDSPEYTEISSKFAEKISNIHNLYFEFTKDQENPIYLKNWSVK